PNAVVVMGEYSQSDVERLELRLDRVEEPEESVDRAPSLLGEFESADPGQALGCVEPTLGEDDEQPGEDTEDAILQARAVGHQGRAHACEMPQSLGLDVRLPDVREEATPEEMRQDLSVDLVGLHLGLGDRPDLERVADD